MKDRDDVDERKQKSGAVDSRKAGFATAWGATFVAFVMGAAIIGNIISLRRRLANFHAHSQGNSSRPGPSARQNTSSQQQGRSQQSGRPYFYQVDETEARRIWEEHVREMERLRRRQEAFDRERMRYKKNYDAWQERHGEKWDWRWHGNRWEWQGESERAWHETSADDWRRESQRSRTRAEPSRASSTHQHYTVLGLDPSRAGSYTDAQIKAAFRAKALEYHPDTNPANKAEAEKKFLKVMEAYNTLRGSKSM